MLTCLGKSMFCFISLIERSFLYMLGHHRCSLGNSTPVCSDFQVIILKIFIKFLILCILFMMAVSSNIHAMHFISLPLYV